MIEKLNKAFDHRVRLGIMSALMVNDHLSFTELKELLNITDGNLASHIKALESENYIQIEKEFVDRKPRTNYMITKSGKTAFKAHIKALEDIINGNT